MVTGIIMASGFSRRMKRNKLLLKLGGQTVIERVIDSCVNSKLSDIILIYRIDDVRDIAVKKGIKVVFNSHAERGQSESVKLGIENAGEKMNGIMFIVGDQPHLDSNTIDKILDEFESHDKNIIIPLYDGKKGNPTIFPMSLKGEMLKLKGDVGGRKVIENNLDKVRYIEIKNHKAGQDMDTLEDYEKLKEDFKNDH